MIVAGSTGSIPATANLIAAIARLPKGAVVLPGLDTDLDEESWRKIGGVGDDDTDPTHTHPQATLRRLVDNHLRVTRSDIVVLGQATEAAKARTRVLSEALRPAETTDLWSEIPTERAPVACAGRLRRHRCGRGDGRARGGARNRGRVARNAQRSAPERGARDARSGACGAGRG